MNTPNRTSLVDLVQPVPSDVSTYETPYQNLQDKHSSTPVYPSKDSKQKRLKRKFYPLRHRLPTQYELHIIEKKRLSDFRRLQNRNFILHQKVPNILHPSLAFHRSNVSYLSALDPSHSVDPVVMSPSHSTCPNVSPPINLSTRSWRSPPEEYLNLTARSYDSTIHDFFPWHLLTSHKLQAITSIISDYNSKSDRWKQASRNRYARTGNSHNLHSDKRLIVSDSFHRLCVDHTLTDLKRRSLVSNSYVEQVNVKYVNPNKRKPMTLYEVAHWRGAIALLTGVSRTVHDLRLSIDQEPDLATRSCYDHVLTECLSNQNTSFQIQCQLNHLITELKPLWCFRSWPTPSIVLQMLPTSDATLRSLEASHLRRLKDTTIDINFLSYINNIFQFYPEIIHVLSSFYLYCTCSSWSQWTAIFALSSPDIFGHVLTTLGSVPFLTWEGLQSMLPSNILFQAGGESVSESTLFEKLGNALSIIPFEQLRDSQLLSSLWDFFGSFTISSVLKALGIFNDGTSMKHLLDSLTPLLRKTRPDIDPLETFLLRLVSLVRIIVERSIEAINLRDPYALFSRGVSISDWFIWSTTVQHDSTIRYSLNNIAMEATFKKRLALNDYPPQIKHQLNRDERVLMIDDLIKVAKILQPTILSTSPHFHRLTNELIDLAQLRLRLIEQLPQGSFRPQPFGIFMTGATSVGKSMLSCDIHSSLALASGYNTDASAMLRIDASTNFVDGSREGQHTVLFDDIDAKVTQPTAGHDSFVEIVNKYINNTPFSLEQAAVEDKGKVWACFSVAIYTTNYPDGRLQTAGCSMTNMFWRRWPLRVDLSVKDQYSNASGGIDSNKAIVDGVLQSNIHNYDVYRYAPDLYNFNTQYHVQPFRLFRRFQTKIDFMAFLVAEYKHWVEVQKKVVSMSNQDTRRLPHCPVCCLPLRDHPFESACTSLQMTPLSDAYNLSALTWLSVFSVATYHGYFSIALIILVLFTLFCLQPFKNSPHLPTIKYYAQNYFSWYVYALGPPLWWYLLNHTESQLILTNLCRVERFLAFKERFRNVNKRTLTSILLAVTTALAGLTYWTYQRRKDNKAFLQMHGSAPSPSDLTPGLPITTERYNDFRAPYGLPKGDSPYKRVPRSEVISPSYGVRNVPVTFTASEMLIKIASRLVDVVTDHGQAKGFRIKGSLIVVNRHLFSGSGMSVTESSSLIRPLAVRRLFVSYDSTSINIPEKDIMSRICEIKDRDIIFIHVPEIPPIKDSWDMPSYLNSHVPSSRVATDEVWLVLGDKPTLHSESGAVCSMTSRPLNCVMWQYNLPTQMKQCGSVLVGRAGPTFSILGVHSLLCGDVAMSTPLSREDYDQALSQFGRFGAGYELQMDPYQINGRHLDFQPTVLPKKSSLRVALSDPEDPLEAILVGTVSSLAGSSNKTKVVDTFFRRDVVVIELEASLGRYPYFAAPQFSGHFLQTSNPPAWHDPYTKFLASVSNCPGERSIWDLALDDYLDGVEAKTQLTQLHPLSDISAFEGVPDTVIGGTNLSTSAGPPFYNKKSVIMRYDHLSDPPILEWSEMFQAQLDTIDLVIRRGDLYSPLCVHVLKDEVVTVSKNENFKIRTFTILPFAFNHYMKRFLAPLTAFMRANMYYFESAVGMNITSLSESSFLANWLSHNPNWIGFDKTAFDARCSTFEHIMVSTFFSRLARVCGYSEVDCAIVYRLCLSSIYPIRSLKSDLFMMSCSMPTGFWMTIHFNCVRSSLQARYAWFDLSRKLNMNATFRSHVRQMTLGDDLIATVTDFVPWYNQIDIANSLLAIGAIATSSDKESALTRYDNPQTIRFLKRKITIVEGLITWSIEEKTLIKMLSMRRTSRFVSDRDAHAMILLNVLNEAVLLGRERYAFYNTLCHRLANQPPTNVFESPFWTPNTFEELITKYASGELVTWDPSGSKNDIDPIIFT